MFVFSRTSVLICYHRLRFLLELIKFCCHVFLLESFCTTFLLQQFSFFATTGTVVCYILFHDTIRKRAIVMAHYTHSNGALCTGAPLLCQLVMAHYTLVRHF
uniref:Uncharacterized protein n=1 Tax=Aegilops tauschii subsp. strangulata TaxID=200361 RepID=A0A453JR84_AEGTS